jgi:CRP/FNR family transcriptional regulator
MTADVSKKIDEKFSKYPKRTYPKGQILLFADEDPEHVYYIVRGKVRQYDVSYRGDEVIVNMYKSPAFFPMSWAINRTANKYFFKTEEETEVHIVPADDALAFIKEHPDVMLDLLGRLYKGMDGLLGRIVHLMSGTAKSRLIYELIIECRRFGTQNDDGSYVLSASEADMGARAGLSRETVSREIHKLKAQGLVEIGRSGIKLPDLAKLEKAHGAEI